MHAIVDRKGLDRMAVSSSQIGRFETAFRATDENVAALAGISGHWIDRVHDRRRPKLIILDMDSSESPTTGNQEGSAYPQRPRDLGPGLAFVTKESDADYGVRRSIQLHLDVPAVSVPSPLGHGVETGGNRAVP